MRNSPVPGRGGGGDGIGRDGASTLRDNRKDRRILPPAESPINPIFSASTLISFRR